MRRRLTTFAVSGAATALVLLLMSATDWFLHPGLGPVVIIVVTAAIAIGTTALISGLQNRKALITAAIPLILFLRSIFFRRPTWLGARMKELKKDFDFAVSALLVLIGCVVVFALGNLVWAWWRSF